ncbi:ubiquitin-like-specific protease 1 [Thrips palmi]|uniref:Ubiquitin-like-specific protease 1 n=1 Tax=Thrips palmi TaxID=161013 RepID=A0A6P8YA31_THRPL|nr:ubiquitin-like-specific protease 1 [Thrips palmi]
METDSSAASEGRQKRAPKRYLNSPSLIAVVQHHPVLWNPNLPNYHISSARTAAWEAVSSRFLDSSPQECSEKWQSLKKALATSKRRQPKSGAAASKKSKPYLYAKNMSFLEGCVINDRQDSSLLPVHSDDDSISIASTNAMEYSMIQQDSDDMKRRGLFLSRVQSNSQSIHSASTLLDGNVDQNEKVEKYLASAASSPTSCFDQTLDLKTVKKNPTKMNKDEANKENVVPAKKQKKIVPKKIVKASKVVPQKLVDFDSEEEELQDEDIQDEKISKKVARQRELESRREQQCLSIRRKIQASNRHPLHPINSQEVANNNLDAIVIKELTKRDDAATYFALSLVDYLRELRPVTLIDTKVKFLEIIKGARLKEECRQNADKEDDIDTLLNCSEDKIVIRKFELCVKVGDLKTLSPGGWLNDMVVDFYFKLIQNECNSVYAFTAFFFPKLSACGYDDVSDWTKKVDIFAYDLLMVPVFLHGNHWALAVIDNVNHQIRYYDSLNGPHNVASNILLQYLDLEMLMKKDAIFERNAWTTIKMENIPMQTNGYDCGMFVCMFGEYEGRRATVDFTQDDMVTLRRKVMRSIAIGRLV